MSGGPLQLFYLQGSGTVIPPIPGTVYQIGTVGSTSVEFTPFDEAEPFGWSYIIYTQQELAAAGVPGTGTINGVAIYNGTVGTSPSPSWTQEDQCIYIGESPVTFFSGQCREDINTTNGYNTTNWQQVLGQGTTGGNIVIPNVQQWHQIPFSAPYSWNYNGSLMIKFENRQDPNQRTTGFNNYWSFNATTQDETGYSFNNLSYPVGAGTKTTTKPIIRLYIS